MVFVSLVISLRFSGGHAADVSYILLAGYAFLGLPQVIQALVFSWMFTMINPGITLGDPAFGGVGRSIVVLSAFVSVMIHTRFWESAYKISRMSLILFILALFLGFHSAFFSSIPDVSFLKATLWVTAAAASFSAWMNMSILEREQTARWVFAVLVTLLVVSVALMFHPVGYFRHQHVFQGAMTHSQTLGPVMAILGVWAASRIIGQGEARAWLVLVALSAIGMVFLSGARTAGVAMVLGLLAAAAVGLVFSRLTARRFFFGLTDARVLIGLMSLLVGGILFIPIVSSVWQEFLNQYASQQGGVINQYMASRGFLMDTMIENIRQGPLSGIGFGIASNPEQMGVDRLGFLGIPVNAPVEKGLAPLAVLEELGIVGAVLVGIWVLMLIIGSSHGGLAPLAVVLCFLLINLGEAFMFAAGGNGLLMLVLFGWAYAAGRIRRRGDCFG
ncbi:hypothetical protein [Thioalkalivibrio sp. ALMg11]|uniref:hypothetical protein n=1 Tax=Thioalkalivibrio sp. ALMg11 TaxID=1158165 RepID=UPI0012DCBEEE|nr:hypothetical protein [Thioalkalivibrio sp. ALMg11]